MENSVRTVKKKLLSSLLRESWVSLSLSVLAAIAAIFLSYMIPYLSTFTLDYVIQGIPDSIPPFLLPAAEKIGRAFWIRHLYLLGVILVLLTVLQGAFTYLRKIGVAFLAENTSRSLREQMYRKLQDVPLDYHKHHQTGDLIQRCTTDIDMIRSFLNTQLLEMIRTFLMVVIAIAIMMSVHVKMTFLCCCMLPLLAGSSFFYFRKVQQYFLEADEAESRVSSVLQENLAGVRVVRAFTQEKDQIDRFHATTESYLKCSLRLNRLLAFFWGCSDSAGYLQIALSLLCGVLFCHAGELTLGQATLFVSYTGMLTWPVRSLGRILADLGKASISLDRLCQVLAAPSETEPGKALRPDLSGELVFDRVSFAYPDDPQLVLDSISFRALPGQTIGILGATGSGKTTLIQLLQRLYASTSGEITINGIPIRDIEAGYLRSQIGIVQQEPFLYAKTILENVRIARPDASEDEIRACCESACIHNEIMKFEQGYQTPVGERGVTLSGGQKQRLAIARALLSDPRILVFDDSLSAVDSVTDAAIRQNIFEKDHTGITIIISHRISSLMHADRILVLDHGRIVQSGTHPELLREEGIYSRIASIQSEGSR